MTNVINVKVGADLLAPHPPPPPHPTQSRIGLNA